MPSSEQQWEAMPTPEQQWAAKPAPEQRGAECMSKPRNWGSHASSLATMGKSHAST